MHQSCSVLEADVGVTAKVKGMNILHLLSSTFPRNQQVLAWLQDIRE